MTRSATTAGSERLLHASPARTVFVHTDADGTAIVTKVFVAGSVADAERELAMGRLLAGDGAIDHLAVETDPATRRPALRLRFVAGTDLGALVAKDGALPAATACRLLEPAARTLARLHGMRRPDAPLGFCHGDVKPKNLLATAATTLWLDFEHAHAIRSGSNDTASDVFGLGASLQWLLTGGGTAKLPQDPAVTDLIARCCDADPTQRPTATAIADELDAIAERLADEPAERFLAAVASGDAAAVTLAPPADALRFSRLRGRLHRLRRNPPATAPLPADATPAELLDELARTQRLLQRFPRHAPTLAHRAALRTASAERLAAAAEHVDALRRAEDFLAAEAHVDDLLELTGRWFALPGGCPLPNAAAPNTIGLLHRDPRAFLHRLAESLAAAHQELDEHEDAVTAAERQLDLVGTETAIERMAQRYGGTSATVARRRDALHRLGFYVDRIARSHANVERLSQLWDKNALQSLGDLVANCIEARDRHVRGDRVAGPIGLRSAQLSLANLIDEFPHLAPMVTPALEALSNALAHVTDQAWQLLADAEQRLRAVPVPVRPLQIALGRLDTFRVLEALVDQPDRPRSGLQDRIDSLRLALDQARATRDRLAQSAENALARGHWTTGVFDMERAVAGLNPQDDQERAEAQRLQERLAAAKRRKQELEGAVRRNVELATRYGTLQDDPESTFEARLQTLRERRDCLLFLAMHLPAERAGLYSRDLRDVETSIALEQAGLAEHRLDVTVDPFERLGLARQTITELAATASPSSLGDAPPGRLVRVLEHWQEVAAHCERAVAQVQAVRAARTRHRRRLAAIAIGALLISVTAIGFAAQSWLGTAQAATRTGHDVDGAFRELAAVADGLPSAQRAAAHRLLDAAQIAPVADDLAWHDAFATELQAFAAAAAPGDATCAGFAQRCWQATVDTAFARATPTQREQLQRATVQLAAAVRDHGLAAPALTIR